MKLFEILTFRDGWSLWSDETGQPFLRSLNGANFHPVERNAVEMKEQAFRAGWYEELDHWIDDHCADETAPLKAALLALVRWRYNTKTPSDPSG